MKSESVDSFVTSLYALAEHCNYGVLHHELTEDRIVVGMQDKGLSEHMHLDAELTLEKAIRTAQQSEEVGKPVQRQVMQDLLTECSRAIPSQLKINITMRTGKQASHTVLSSITMNEVHSHGVKNLASLLLIQIETVLLMR